MTDKILFLNLRKMRVYEDMYIYMIYKKGEKREQKGTKGLSLEHNVCKRHRLLVINAYGWTGGWVDGWMDIH